MEPSASPSSPQLEALSEEQPSGLVIRTREDRLAQRRDQKKKYSSMYRQQQKSQMAQLEKQCEELKIQNAELRAQLLCKTPAVGGAQPTPCERATTDETISKGENAEMPSSSTVARMVAEKMATAMALREKELLEQLHAEKARADRSEARVAELLQASTGVNSGSVSAAEGLRDLAEAAQSIEAPVTLSCAEAPARVMRYACGLTTPRPSAISP